MRRAVPIVVLAMAQLAVVLACAPLAAAKPPVLKPTWRLVPSSQYDSVTAGDRYVALYRPAPISNDLLTLIDEQTGQRRTLSIPSCSAGWNSTQAALGGQWLLVGCSLYNLSTNTWTPFTISQQCPGGCTDVGVGRYWISLVDIGDDPEHNPPRFYLQNIASGQLIQDPATPGGTVYDDLNAPSGSTPLCPPLRYPTDRASYGSWLGTLSFYGSGPSRFALAYSYGLNTGPSSRLQRCGSNMNLPATVVSSRASISGSGPLTLQGWLLPGLQRFTIRSTLPPGQTNPISPVAVTARRMYVSAENRRIYSAPIPTVRQIRACARYQHRRHKPRKNPCRYNP